MAVTPPRLAYVAALLVGVFGFALRLLAMRGLPNDHYIYLSAAQQILLGEIPGRDFVEPGMFLQFLISAAGQAVAPGPSTEGIITGALMALAASATCVGVAWLTQSVTAGTGAALFQVVLFPRLYSFPKVLVPAVLLVLALTYARRTRISALVLMAVWIVVAILLRHDIGAYAAIAGAAAVALSHRTPGEALRRCAMLTAVVLLILLPYFAYLEWSGGIVEHVRGSFEYGKAEEGGFDYDWPVITFDAEGRSDGVLPWNRDDAAAFLFYCAYALPVIAVLLVVASAEHRRSPLTRAAVGSAVVIALFYIAIILRHPVLTRVPDVASVLAILGGWCVAATVRVARPTLAWRLSVAAPVTAVVLAAFVSGAVLVELADELDEAQLLDSPSEMRAHAREVITLGREFPWRTYWPTGSPPDAVAYLSACTSPGDRLWLSWPAPEWYFFTRRGFGAGHANTLSPHSFKTPKDQALMIARLDRNKPPIVLTNESTRAEFAAAYPQVDEYVRTHYMPHGHFEIRDGSTIAIATRVGLKPASTYGAEGWPCHMAPDPAA